MRITRSKYDTRNLGPAYPFRKDGIEALCKFIADEMNKAVGAEVFKAVLQQRYGHRETPEWFVVYTANEAVILELASDTGLWNVREGKLTRIEATIPHKDPNHYRATCTRNYTIKSVQVKDTDEYELSFNAKGVWATIRENIETRQAAQLRRDDTETKTRSVLAGVAAALKSVRLVHKADAQPGGDTITYRMKNGVRLTVYGTPTGYKMSASLPTVTLTDPQAAVSFFEALATFGTGTNYRDDTPEYVREAFEQMAKDTGFDG